MRRTHPKLLAAGLLVGGLTLVSCATSRTPQESPYPEGPEGYVSKTKQSDDNLRMPLEDPFRTKQQESIRAAELEPGVRQEQPGGSCTGGSGDSGTGGSGDSGESSAEPATGGSGVSAPREDVPLNEGGNVDSTLRPLDEPR